MMASMICTDVISVVDGLHTSCSEPQTNGNSNVFPSEGALGPAIAYGYHEQRPSTQRCFPTQSPGSRMPVSTSSQSLLASLPSFMSVFGNGPDRLEAYEGDAAATASQGGTSKRLSNIAQPTPPTDRRDSASTFESTESSPTTTISTAGSSLTEPSPRSPPETPESSSPFKSFKSLRTNSMPTNQLDMERKDAFASSFPVLPGVERGDSPNKKMRNMKNLSVNTSASNRTNPQLPKLGLSNPSQTSTNAFSAPPTPAFIVPPKIPKKKPSTLPLTITTPDSSNSGHDRPSAVIQSPSDPQIRTLRLLQTSSNGALFSPTVAPEGGMRLPPFPAPAMSSRPFTAGGRIGKARPPLSVSPLSSFDTSTSSPITRQTLDHVQEETDYEPPLSQEVKSPAYPQGPVCIYDPLVYLYLEPSHVEAREFDVILNVAREVMNPFLAAQDKDAKYRKERQEIQRTSNTEIAYPAGRDSVSEPQTAVSEKSFASALEAQMEDASMTAPGTPKASKPEPEYIHVPWDHNTNVVDDLLRLCELIDNRVRRDKKVLVHCQCGVSRSASLVVAYGLYKNPQLTVQEAYDAVKFRSKWIGPNMNLIYQLSEFKTKLVKTHPMGTAAWHSWRALGSGRSNAAANPNLDSNSHSSALRTPPQKSLSAPSQIGRDARSSSFSPPSSAQLAPTSLGNITPGPSSAPPDMQWSPGQRSPAPECDAVSKFTEPLSTSPPRISDSDIDMVISPSTIEREGIEETKPSASTREVVNDLQEVAKDLTNNEHDSTGMSLPRLDFGPEITMSLPQPDGDSLGRIWAVPASRTGQTLQPEASELREASDKEEKSARKSSPIPGSMKFVTEGPSSQRPATPIKETEMTLLPTSPTTVVSTPSPTLPAGFSSLLRRWQGPHGLRQLPLHSGQPLPQLTTAQPSPRAIDPDFPQTPSLLSPRAAEFTASPFHRTSAGDLAGSSVFEQGLMSPGAKEEDPRSPHQVGEAPITRSIFDMI